MLYHELGQRGMRASLFAHSTTGHTTTNPWVLAWRPIPGVISTEPEPGNWLVEPHSELWAVWVKLLRETTFRYKFPFMAQAELERYLRGFPCPTPCSVA